MQNNKQAKRRRLAKSRKIQSKTLQIIPIEKTIEVPVRIQTDANRSYKFGGYSIIRTIYKKIKHAVSIQANKIEIAFRKTLSNTDKKYGKAHLIVRIDNKDRKVLGATAIRGVRQKPFVFANTQMN